MLGEPSSNGVKRVCCIFEYPRFHHQETKGLYNRTCRLSREEAAGDPKVEQVRSPYLPGELLRLSGEAAPAAAADLGQHRGIGERRSLVDVNISLTNGYLSCIVRQSGL